MSEEVEKHFQSSEEKIKLFGHGEWVEEPDEVKFQYKGFDCMVVRIMKYEHSGHAFGGHLCGYVKIPKGHPWHGQNFGDIDCNCHGGLTYSETEENGEYWIGFDCAHFQDITPSIELMYKTDPAMIKLRQETNERMAKAKYLQIDPLAPTYKNIYYCKDECKEIVEQAIKAKDGMD